MHKAVLNVFNRTFNRGRAGRGGEGASRAAARAGLGHHAVDGLRQAGRSDARAAGGGGQARRHRAGRAWPPPSSSCWKGCTSPRSSTRTSRPAATVTGAERDARSTATRAGMARSRSISTPTSCSTAMADDLLADGDPWRALQPAHAAGRPHARRAAHARAQGPAGAAAPPAPGAARTATTSARASTTSRRSSRRSCRPSATAIKQRDAGGPAKRRAARSEKLRRDPRPDPAGRLRDLQNYDFVSPRPSRSSTSCCSRSASR